MIRGNSPDLRAPGGGVNMKKKKDHWAGVWSCLQLKDNISTVNTWRASLL